jgi:hypothetical protein
MLVIVTRVCYGHVNPRSAFLDHSSALFHVRKKEVEKKLRKITIFFFKIFFEKHSEVKSEKKLKNLRKN